VCNHEKAPGAALAACRSNGAAAALAIDGGARSAGCVAGFDATAAADPAASVAPSGIGALGLVSLPRTESADMITA
jgi:hypothetical protein